MVHMIKALIEGILSARLKWKIHTQSIRLIVGGSIDVQSNVANIAIS